LFCAGLVYRYIADSMVLLCLTYLSGTSFNVRGEIFFMLYLEVVKVEKYFSDRLILKFDDLKIYRGDKIGLIGANGAGKTTLLNILAGLVEPDRGFVKTYCNLAYIRQFLDEESIASDQLPGTFNLDSDRKSNICSGGEQTQVKIANALNGAPQLLLADEPTANLDYKHIKIFEQQLKKIDTIILVTHDRQLLDGLCNKTLEISDGQIKSYQGNYSFYRQQKEHNLERATLEYNKYESEKAKLENAISNQVRRSGSIKKTPRRMGNSEARLHKRAANEKKEKLDGTVKSIATRLKKLEKKAKPRDVSSVKFDFSPTELPQSRIIIKGCKFSYKYDAHLVFEQADFVVPRGLKTALWGDNGTGKTTLLNLITNGISGQIKVVPKAMIGYFCQDFKNLDYNRTVLENVLGGSTVTQSEARIILSRLLIGGDDVFKKVGVLSGGERIKVSFAKLFLSEANVLLLDEPTNYLDIPSVEALEHVLKDYKGTVLFASHDRSFIDHVADRLLVVAEKKITAYEGHLCDYLQMQLREAQEEETKLEQIALKMRMAEIADKLGRPEANKEALEEEYQKLVLRLNVLCQVILDSKV